MKGEMKVSDVRSWVLRNETSTKGVWFAEMLLKNYSTGLEGWTNRSLNGAWISTWEVEKLFTTFLEDGERRFKSMDVPVYIKDNPAIEPSIF